MEIKNKKEIDNNTLKHSSKYIYIYIYILKEHPLRFF